MPDRPKQPPRPEHGAPPVLRLAGLAALAGGLCWTVKAAVVLAGGEQPDLLFELAPAAQGLGLALLAFAPAARKPVLGRLAGLAAAALGAAAAAAHLSLPDNLLANALFLLANLSVVAGAFFVGGWVRRHAVLGRRSGVLREIGIWTVPGILLGGLLSEYRDPLLELPILALGLAWMLVGGLCLTRRERPDDAGQKRPAAGKGAKPTGASAGTARAKAGRD